MNIIEQLETRRKARGIAPSAVAVQARIRPHILLDASKGKPADHRISTIEKWAEALGGRIVIEWDKS